MSDGGAPFMRRQAERLELLDRLGRQSARAGLGTNPVVAFDHQDATSGLREHLSGAQSGGTGADDDVLDPLHHDNGTRRAPPDASRRQRRVIVNCPLVNGPAHEFVPEYEPVIVIVPPFTCIVPVA